MHPQVPGSDMTTARHFLQDTTFSDAHTYPGYVFACMFGTSIYIAHFICTTTFLCANKQLPHKTDNKWRNFGAVFLHTSFGYT